MAIRARPPNVAEHKPKTAGEAADVRAENHGCIQMVPVEKSMPALTTFYRGVEIAVQPHSKRGETRGITFQFRQPGVIDEGDNS